MSAYDYTIEYKPGSHIVTADAMSRLSLREIFDVATGCVIHLINRDNNSMINFIDKKLYLQGSGSI